MGKHNYNKDFQKENTTPEVETAVENEEVVLDHDVIIESEVKGVELQVEPITGVVTDCVKLNIRKEPVFGSEVLCTVNALSELLINPEDSTDKFYKVCTSTGVEGYCMKKYVIIKQ